MVTRPAASGKGTILVAIVLLAAAVLGEDQPKPQYGFEVGKRLPLLVVDFLAGPNQDQCGCPAIMVRNQRVRGIVICSRTFDPSLAELAQALEREAVDGDKLHGYLVQFDRDSKKLVAACADRGVVKFNVGMARTSAKEWFKFVGLPDDATCAVCLLDREGIQATWTFTSAQLMAEQSAEILNAARSFVPGAGQ